MSVTDSMIVILVFGLYHLRSRELDLKVDVRRSWFPRVSHWHWSMKTLFIFIYAGMNIFILIINALVVASGADSPIPVIAGKYFPTVIFSIVGLGLLYYYAGFAAFVPNKLWKGSFLYLVLENCEIQKEPTFDPARDRIRRFGQRREIRMIVSIRARARAKELTEHSSRILAR